MHYVTVWFGKETQRAAGGFWYLNVL